MNRSSQFRVVVLASLLIILSSVSVCAQQFASRASRASTLPTVSTISTLYSNDPIARTLCFADGQSGGVIQNGGVYNRCSNIDFDNYKTSSFSVGIEGGQVGRIIDLGTADELSKQYGYGEGVGKGQGFASIEFRDGKVRILKERYKPDRQELLQAARLFEKGESSASAEAKVGHIYIARITDTHKPEFQILVKLLVLSVRPGESVTFRWELL
ncbi:MAG TPA: hypothetical protein VJV21_00140 [Pyrinomonadaceae bacterium]|nr:hypothetical protein [Pyrinomonadaceae bacterium]